MQWTDNKILNLCARLGITQRELALRLGVDEARVSEWVNGRYAPSPMACRLLDHVAANPTPDDLRRKKIRQIDATPA